MIINLNILAEWMVSDSAVHMVCKVCIVFQLKSSMILMIDVDNSLGRCLNIKTYVLKPYNPMAAHITIKYEKIFNQLPFSICHSTPLAFKLVLKWFW